LRHYFWGFLKRRIFFDLFRIRYNFFRLPHVRWFLNFLFQFWLLHHHGFRIVFLDNWLKLIRTIPVFINNFYRVRYVFSVVSRLQRFSSF
jgi:hypothetical protein